MKKIIRLTESDLVRLVKRVISEQEPARTSQRNWNDITDFIDTTGNQGCSKPFRIINNQLFAKAEENFLKVIDNNKIVYKPTGTKTQLGTGKVYSNNPANINTCPEEEIRLSNFGKSKLFQTLITNPGKIFSITYS